MALALALPLARRSRLLCVGGARSGGEGPLLRKFDACSGGESLLLRKFGACIDLEDKCLIPSVLVRVRHAEIRAGTGIPKRSRPTTRAGTDFSKHSLVGGRVDPGEPPILRGCRRAMLGDASPRVDLDARCLAVLGLMGILVPGA